MASKNSAACAVLVAFAALALLVPGIGSAFPGSGFQAPAIGVGVSSPGQPFATNVRSTGALCDGVTDDTIAVQAALDISHHSVYVPAGTCIVSNLTVSVDGSRIFGDGAASVLKMKVGATGALLTMASLGVVIEDIKFDGGTSATFQGITASPANRSGLSLSGRSASALRSIVVTGFDNTGIIFTGAGSDGRGEVETSVVNSNIGNNWKGVQVGSERVLFASLSVYRSYIAMKIPSGNIAVVNCDINTNTYGVWVDGPGSGNSGHGSVTATMINHNATPIYVDTVTNGFNFISDHIFYGDIRIFNSHGINIASSIIDADSWTITGNGWNNIRGNFIVGSNSNDAGQSDYASKTAIVDDYENGAYFLGRHTLVSDGNLEYDGGMLSVLTPNTIGVTAVPTMTSLTAPSGVVSATSTYSGSYPAWQAFNGQTADVGWVSQIPVVYPQDLKYAFPAGVLTTPTRYAITAPYACCGPKDFKLQGSNDNSAWTDLDTETGVTWTAAQTRTYNFSNTVDYRYFRLHITDSGDHSDGVYVAELSINQAFNAAYSKVGIGVVAANNLDVKGSAVIGRAIAGTAQNKSDSLVVQNEIDGRELHLDGGVFATSINIQSVASAGKCLVSATDAGVYTAGSCAGGGSVIATVTGSGNHSLVEANNSTSSTYVDLLSYGSTATGNFFGSLPNTGLAGIDLHPIASGAGGAAAISVSNNAPLLFAINGSEVAKMTSAAVLTVNAPTITGLGGIKFAVNSGVASNAFIGGFANSTTEGMYFLHNGTDGALGPAQSVVMGVTYGPSGTYRSMTLATSDIARLTIDPAGVVAIKNLSAGIVQASSDGSLTSSPLNAGTSLTGVTPVANGGTGLSTNPHNHGQCTLSALTCTATVTAGNTCTCTAESTLVGVDCSVTSTTMTATANATGTGKVTYDCWPAIN